MPYVLAQSAPSGPPASTPTQTVHMDGPWLPSAHHHHHHFYRSPSQIQLAQPHNSTSFPSLDSRPTADRLPSSTSTPVPFPKLPSRKKRVRGVGTLPWHHTASSDSEDDSSHGSSSTSSPTLLPALPIAPLPTLLPPPPPPRHAIVKSTPTLKLDLSAVSRRTLSESQIVSSLTPAVGFGPLSSSTTPIYRKNGTPVKSSLKSSRSSPTDPTENSARRPSLPNTPSMEKIVHFDAQLEQIKFFKKDHKPSSISREGSPEDTEEDSEFVSSGHDQRFMHRKGRSFYPGSSEEEKIRQTLVLERVNIPLRNALAQPDEILGSTDVKLEKIGLSTDAKLIEGTIIVRNLAFEKWIAVRFTFDWWQTTSEVAARYRESIHEYNIDRFEYSIRLPDVTCCKIEEKRLFVAIRYTTAGREIWDNNNRENYHLRFKRITTPEKEKKSSASNVHPPSWPVKSANVDQMADLRRKLEKVVQEDEEEQGSSAWESLTAKLRARNMHIEEEREKEQPLSLRKRYDFQESSKVKWKAPQDLPKVTVPASAAGIPFPSSSPAGRAGIHGGLPRLHSRGSPREPELEHSPKFFLDPRDGNDLWHSHPHQRSHSHSPSTTRGRHHQRGYFDSWFEDATAQGLRLTPPSGLPAPTPTVSASSTATTCTVSIAPAPEEILSETESNSSITSTSTSSSSTSIAEDMGLSVSGDRSTVRYNSFPMDRSHISPPAAAAAAVSVSAPDAHLTPQAWIVSPLGSSAASFSSTPSVTSASSPSQCPSSPSESMLDASANGRFGASTLEDLDYSYFLSR